MFTLVGFVITIMFFMWAATSAVVVVAALLRWLGNLGRRLNVISHPGRNYR